MTEGGQCKEIYWGLSRPESTIVILLRTEHIRFRAYLAKRRVLGVAPECDYS